MSYINIDLRTDKENGDINITVKSECTEAELEVATVNMMGMLAQTNGIDFLENVVKDFYKRDIENSLGEEVIDEQVQEGEK